MKPTAKLIGQDGNIFNLMAIASIALRDAGQSQKAIEMRHKITRGAKSYDEALMIIWGYVDIE